MKLLIFKVGTILNKEAMEELSNKLERGLNKGVILLDDTCKYEVVEVEGMNVEA